MIPNSFADLGQWVNNIGCLLGAVTSSRSTSVSHHRSSEKIKSSWDCQADVPFQSTARLRLLSGVHLAEGDTNWWPYPCTLCFIPNHVLWCISCLQVCWLKGSGLFLRCSWKGVGSWWDFHANKACPEHLGRVSEERTAWVGASAFWTKVLGSRVVVFLSGFKRHSCYHAVLCCTCFRQPLLNSANAERLRGFFGFFFLGNLETSLIIHLPA